jgi:diadenosine tetraphosphate (Ap4A) HIT family hydrolase
MPLQDGERQRGEAPEASCVFCQRASLHYVLKETSTFLLVADHAPLVEGHLLIIPREHYLCYGAVPDELDEQLHSLKEEVKRFAGRFYGPVLFWEHGIFRQTVSHAHLHAIPFGIASYDLGVVSWQPGAVVREQEDLRRWYRAKGAYFYLEDGEKALLFPPDPDCYQQVVYHVLWKSLSPEQQRLGWHRKEERMRVGGGWPALTARKWEQFRREQEGLPYVDRSGTR